MNSYTKDLRALVAQDAAEWFLLNREGTLTEASRAQFTHWLRASPLHVEEYLAIAAIAKDMHVATSQMAVDPEALSEAHEEANQNIVDLHRRNPAPSIGVHTRPARRRWRTASFAGACATVLAIIGVSAIALRNAPKTYLTSHGEQSIWPLSDGSILQLNSDSAVTVRYSSKERLLDVVRGQAHFRVAHESSRRFRVVSGPTEVVAVGTDFDVYRMATSTVVTVIEGRVAVFAGAAPPPTAIAAIPADALRVNAGEQVRIDGDRKLTAAAPADLRQTTAWMRRQIVFDHKPLAEVADEFNRYSNASIRIDDEKLRELQVSGVFDAYDTDSFAGFLQRLDGVTVSVTPTQIYVLRRANSAAPEQ
jgi:transmembrane sensor